MCDNDVIVYWSSHYDSDLNLTLSRSHNNTATTGLYLDTSITRCMIILHVLLKLQEGKDSLVRDNSERIIIPTKEVLAILALYNIALYYNGLLYK